MTFIPVAAPVIGERELAYVTDAVRSGWVSSIGPYIERFERSFADYIDVSHAIAVSNGTVALHLVLHALGIGPGDEVLVPDLTFVATAHAVLQTGAMPVFVDADPQTWCIDPLAVERAVTPRTRAILPVHLYGRPADMTALLNIAQKHNLVVLEDAAEAHGAEVGGRRVGGLGRVGTFSFYGNKIITTGEGGMVTTNDDALAERLRFLKDHGMSPQRRYYHSELAFNYRMTNLQAALGLAQMEQIDAFIARKSEIFHGYSEVLEGVPGLGLNPQEGDVKSVYWLICAVLGPESQLSRDGLALALREHEIDSRPFFIPMHQLPHLHQYRTVGREGDDCPEADRLSASGLNLPSGCTLEDATVRHVAETVRQLLTK